MSEYKNLSSMNIRRLQRDQPCIAEFIDSIGLTHVVKATSVKEWINSLSDEDLAAMHVFAKKIARAIEKAFPCKKVGEAVIGLEVPHAHIHLIPIKSESDMNFRNPKLKLSPDEMKEIAQAVRL